MPKQQSNITVPPFTILIDNREGHPYNFANIPPPRSTKKTIIVRTETIFLPTGDYSIKGFADVVAVERKSIEDLFMTLGKNRQRFKREMMRLQDFDYAAIIIESDWQTIAKPSQSIPNWQSQMNPRAILSTIISWTQQFNSIHWFMCGSRRYAEICCFEILEKWWKNNQKLEKEKKP